MKFGILIGLMWGLVSCSTLRSDEVRGVPVDPRVRAEQEGEIQKADTALESRDFPMAENLYADFQMKFPTSVFFQRAQFGRAKALESQEKWAEAADLYRKTIDATRGRQPEIAAQALYQISFCYENLGDEARVLASLQDALKLKEQLRPEQVLAEIPARMAASFNRMGDSEEALIHFRKAEAGIQAVRAQQKPERAAEWLSKTYYHMGAFSTNQLSIENLQASLDTLKMVQTFSLRSAEAGGQPWAKMASQGLISNYRDLWRTVRQIPLNKTMDPGAAKREQLDRQTNFAGQILTLINELKVYKAPSDSEPSEAVKELTEFLARVEKVATEFLYSGRERTPLTPEAEKRGGLKK